MIDFINRQSYLNLPLTHSSRKSNMGDIAFTLEIAALNHFSYPLLLQCITQKICHDLATPVGAIRLGLENLPENEFTPILMESIENATHRIEIFRTLFSQSTDNIDSERAGKLLKAYLASKSIQCTTEGSSKGQPARLLLGMGVVASECLPRGGTIHVDFDRDEILCQGTIIHMPFDAFTADSILMEHMHFKSGIILFHILQLAEAENITLNVHQEQNTLSFRLDSQRIA